MVNIFHPSLFKLVEYLQLNENYQKIICQQVQNGQFANSQYRTYRLINERLIKMFRNYGPANTMTFLRSMAVDYSNNLMLKMTLHCNYASAIFVINDFLCIDMEPFVTIFNASLMVSMW
ncbi:hypothetical protein RF11_12766 [Thelohanellus kitauei]|uniref:Uncharacterized protein n=1 Tax=Thelohanellus kitauei TaxID=669202 RepID=A0A0C2IWV6_THEKT|nr:hypothetical protein RF11_12766 [Thelohanellus kitauei]